MGRSRLTADRAAADCLGVPRSALVLVLMALAGCAAPLEPPAVTVHEALRLEIAEGDVGRPPPDDAAFASAPRVRLPDVWPAARRVRARAAWYRTSIDLPAAATVPWAVYLPRAVMNAGVWLSGAQVGEGRGRHVNRPLLVVLPAGSLRAGRNTVDVQLRVEPTYISVLDAFVVGPEAAVRPSFESRFFWQVTVVELAIALTLCLGGSGLALMLRRREVPGFAESSLAAVLWGIAMLDLVVREPPLPALAWQWFVTSALAAVVAAMVIGSHRFLALGRPRLERAVVMVWAAGAASFAIALARRDPRLVDGVILVWAGGTMAMGVYLVWLLFLIPRQSQVRSLRVAPTLGVAGFIVGAHDIALAFGTPIAPSVVLTPYVGSLGAIWVGWRVNQRFVEALDESQALNRDLERRVAERGQEIARGYDRIRRLEHDRAVQDERERLMRDIHDGFGGQLASTLALVEQADVPRDEIAEALRDALDDMRLVVSSLAPIDADLIGLLASWRARIERRLERHGVRFDWRVTDVPPLPWLGPREALHVLRVFQEAVSNVVQHAGATTITVRTGARPDLKGRPGVFVEIQDDGRGVSPTPDHPGAGLRNMTQRATDLSGTITVDGAGTLVILWLPVAGPSPTQ